MIPHFERVQLRALLTKDEKGECFYNGYCVLPDKHKGPCVDLEEVALRLLDALDEADPILPSNPITSLYANAKPKSEEGETR
jgi:hypothetical protein